MRFRSEDSTTCLNQALTLLNINGLGQYQVEWTLFATDWIQIRSRVTVLKVWTEYNQWSKPPKLMHKKVSFTSHYWFCHIVFSDCLCPGYCLLLPSVSARCQQLTNFGGVFLYLSRQRWNVGMTSYFMQGVDKISETLANLNIIQQNGCFSIFSWE